MEARPFPGAVAGGVRNPVDASGRIRAVLFDVDGTLYRQGPLRALMALEVATLPLRRPWRGWRHLRALGAYRRAQETLRAADEASGLEPDQQVRMAAREANLPPAVVEQLVREWMNTRPLKYLPRFVAAGLPELLSWLDESGVPVGVFSDYAAEAKLLALGLAGRFSPVLCATDSAIGALKPHPRGFLHACRVWHLPPHEVLMVGDRTDVDAAGAAAAGMPCVIVSRAHGPVRSPNCLVVPSLERLRHVLDDRR